MYKIEYMYLYMIFKLDLVICNARGSSVQGHPGLYWKTSPQNKIILKNKNERENYSFIFFYSEDKEWRPRI